MNNINFLTHFNKKMGRKSKMRLIFSPKVLIWFLILTIVSVATLINVTDDVIATSTVVKEGANGCRMTLSKSVNAEYALPGGELVYTVSIENTGEGNCTGGGVEVQEYYDPMVIYVSSTPDPFSGNDVWNYGTVEPDESHTITVNVLISEELESSVSNKACVWASEFGSKSNSDNWLCTEIVIPPFDVCEDNSAPQAVITPVDQTITMGDDITFSAIPSSDPEGDPLTYAWSIEPAGIQGEGETMPFTPTAIGEFTITLVVTDPCGATHETTTILTVEEDLPPVFCQITLTKTAFPAVVAQGGQIDYTINFVNTGDGNCTGGGVELVEYYSDLSTFISSDPVAWEGNDKWNYGTVVPGEEHTVDIVTTVSEEAVDGDIVTNKVCVWASEFGAKDVEENWKCVTVDTPVEEGNECVDNATPVPAMIPLDTTITLGETVDFTNQSTDTEGDPMNYTWTVDGTTIEETTVDFSFTPTETGVFIVNLKAKDECSYDETSTTVTVEVPEHCIDNATPVPVIDPLDQDVLIDQSVSFTASGSTDVEGDPLIYTWYVDGVEVATGVDYIFSSSVPDQYIIKLVVADECGSDETETIVNVSESEQCLGHVDPTPVIDPQNPSITFGNNVAFNSNSSYDDDTDPMSFEWFVDDTSISTDPGFTYNPPTEGIYTVKLTATDMCGDATVETNLTVTPGGENCVGNSLPIAVAGDDLAIDVGKTLTLDASGSSDPNGDALTYTWEIPSIGFVSNDQVATISFDTNNPEKHMATLTVRDECGSSTDTMEINVHSGGGGPTCISASPTAVAGPDFSVNNGETFILDGTGSSDPENDVLSYSWKIQAVGFTANTATTSTVIDQPGKYIAELQVADACSNNTDSLEIEVLSGGGPVCTENCEPEPVCTENCGGGGPDPEPKPIVLGEATSTVQTFTAPIASPRAGSGLPITQLALGLLAGLVTAIGAYFITRRKYSLQA